MTAEKKALSRLKALQEQFPQKQINRLISFTKKCPLSRPARIVYSLMMFRCKRKGRHVAVSISSLARLSGMHRTTVSKSLTELKKRYVVIDKEGLWSLCHTNSFTEMPNAAWYGWRGKHHTIKDLAYNWYLQPTPDAPISLVDALVLSADLQGKVPARCLAVRLHMDRKTVTRSRAKINALQKKKSWFADIGPHRKKKDQPARESDFLGGFEPGLQQAVVGKMLRSSPPWTQKEISRFFQIAKDHCRTDDAMFNAMALLLNPGARSFDEVMRQHRYTGREGSGMGLVLRKLGWA